MSIPEIAIKRPVMTYMLAVLFIVLGFIGYSRISVQAQPNVNYPILTITTEYPGADAELIDQVVTKPLEQSFNTVGNIKTINSYSETGKSSITISFNFGTDMQKAYDQVSSQINIVQSTLPQDVHYPTITQTQTDDQPIILLALTGKQSLNILNDYARNKIVNDLENINGVGKVQVFGAAQQALNIDLDLAKMASLKLSINEVQSAFAQEYVHLPGGTLNVGTSSYVLNLNLEYQKVTQMQDLIVAYRNNLPVYLKDIATITIGPSSQSGAAYYDHEPAIGIGVIKQSGANTLAIIDAVNARIANFLKPNLPYGMQISTVYSQQKAILNTISQLEQDLWFSVFAAGFVILYFLLSLRPTLMVMCVIPVSLMISTFGLYVFNYTLNAITLLGAVVLVGVVVDDSIVVLENIYEKMKSKTTSVRDAAIEGAKQIQFSVIACSLTLVCIFLPIAFLQGSLGLLFKSFAIVITVGILASLILSLTLTPVMCAAFLKPVVISGKFATRAAESYAVAAKWYDKFLAFVLKHPGRFLIAVLLLVLASYPAYHFLNKGFMPADTNTGYFTVQIQAPVSMSVDYTRGRVEAAENLLKSEPYVANYFVVSGPTPNQGSISVILKPKHKLTQLEIMQDLKTQLDQIPGAEYFVQLPDNTSQVTFDIRGNDFAQLLAIGGKLYSALSREPDFQNLYIVYTPNQPQYEVNLNRVLANSFGITPKQVADTLMVMGSGGVKIAKFTDMNNQSYDILLRAKKGSFTDADDLESVYLQSKGSEPISLNAIVSLEHSLKPSKITRTDLVYSISYVVQTDLSTSKAMTLINNASNSVLPKGYSLSFTGNTAQVTSTQHQMFIILGFIFIFMYIVLASQFNSFLQPFIIMTVQPLAVIGGIFALLIFDQTLNVYSMIGMLLLVGLVTKNSILLVSLANQYLAEGKTAIEALLMACPIRLKPILMTSFAIVITMVPPLFASDATYRSLSLVIIAGILSSTVLSLGVVPACYLLLERFIRFDHKIVKKSTTKTLPELN